MDISFNVYSPIKMNSNQYKKLPEGLTLDIVLDACNRQHTSLDNPGFCLSCGAEHFECEPDAENYHCDDCGTDAVFGAEQILIMFA
jgi:hypothetical protein